MRSKETFYITFFLFLTLSLFVFVISNTPLGKGVTSVFEQIASPFQNLGIQTSKIFTSSVDNSLKNENISLRKKLIDEQSLKNENTALRDQFQTQNPNSSNLLPAKVVGEPGFFPGVSLPSTLILDKGESDGVKAGQSVVLSNNLVGEIQSVTSHLSKVELVYDTNSLIVAKTENQVLGVVKGGGDGDIILDNVLLSDKISVSETVSTKGSLNEKGLGFPPDLIIGKIVSVDKKASNLFQSAKLKSLLDFSRLDIVYIVINSQ